MKEKLNMFDRNSTKGITLITLVVTIIVLLILAGVSIAALSGPNGLVKRANEAKTETGKAGAEEKVEVEVLRSFDNRGSLSTELLNENLKNVQGMSTNTYDSGYYWLASPYPYASDYDHVCYVHFNGVVNGSSCNDYGVRPAVCLTSNIHYRVDIQTDSETGIDYYTLTAE